MFLIFIYLAIFIAAIYIFFKFLVVTSSYLLLIDENFLNKIQDTEDNIIMQFRNPASSNTNNTVTNNDENSHQEEKITNELNSYLRMDFFITLILGIVWFIIPKLLFQFSPTELKYLPPDFKYLGQSLAILTIFTTIIPIKTIKKNTYDKKLVLATKLLCAIVILIIQASYIYFYQRINVGNIITVLLLAFWTCNSVSGILIKRTMKIKENEKVQMMENKKKRQQAKIARRNKKKNKFS